MSFQDQHKVSKKKVVMRLYYAEFTPQISDVVQYSLMLKG